MSTSKSAVLGPRFFMHTDVEILSDDSLATIVRRGGRIHMDPAGAWSDQHSAIARKFRITSLALRQAHFGKRKTADFLLDLPPLRELHLGLDAPRDVRAVEQLETLEYLGVLGDVVHPEHPDPPAVDLSKLKRLQSAALFLCPPMASILHCSWLRSLKIIAANESPLGVLLRPNGAKLMREWRKERQVPLQLSSLPKLESLHLQACVDVKDLDLSRQAHLTELLLEVVPKLRSVMLHPEARIEKLKVDRTGAFRVDWKRVGPTLKVLDLVGPLRFPLTDILQAPQLEELHTNGIRKFPPLDFLLQLPRLRLFDMFSTPPGPKFSERDYEVLRTMRARGNR